MHGVSDTYLIETDQGKFIFKVHRVTHRSMDELQGEVAILDILKANNAKVSYVIEDIEGNQIQTMEAAEGTKHGILYSFAEGKMSYDFTDKQLHMLGREMAFNHNILVDIEIKHNRLVYDTNTTLKEPIQVLEEAFEDYREGWQYMSDLADRVIKKMATYDLNSFSYGYCHYDYMPKNFHFDEQDNLTVFDFDFLGKGELVNDLMSFKVHYFLHVVVKGMPFEESEACFAKVIEGYRSVRHLSDAETEAIAYYGIMFWTFYLAYQYQHYEEWSNSFFNQAHLRTWVERLKKWEELYCSF